MIGLIALIICVWFVFRLSTGGVTWLTKMPRQERATCAGCLIIMVGALITLGLLGTTLTPLPGTGSRSRLQERLRLESPAPRGGNFHSASFSIFDQEVLEHPERAVVAVLATVIAMMLLVMWYHTRFRIATVIILVVLVYLLLYLALLPPLRTTTTSIAIGPCDRTLFDVCPRTPTDMGAIITPALVAAWNADEPEHAVTVEEVLAAYRPSSVRPSHLEFTTHSRAPHRPALAEFIERALIPATAVAMIEGLPPPAPDDRRPFHRLALWRSVFAPRVGGLDLLGTAVGWVLLARLDDLERTLVLAGSTPPGK